MPLAPCPCFPTEYSPARNESGGRPCLAGDRTLKCVLWDRGSFSGVGPRAASPAQQKSFLPCRVLQEVLALVASPEVGRVWPHFRMRGREALPEGGSQAEPQGPVRTGSLSLPRHHCLCADAVPACAPGCVWLFVTQWTVACQAPLSMGFSRQDYWSRLPFPSLGDLPDPGIEPVSSAAPALAGGFFNA